MRKWVILVLLSAPLFAMQNPANNKYFAWVNNLNIRTEPGVSSKILCQLKEGEIVEYLGIVTCDTTNIVFRGIEFDAPWAKVKNFAGIEGWVYAGGLKKCGEGDLKIELPPPGKPGVIPDSVTVSSYSELTNALQDETSNRVIFLKEGVYTILSPVNFSFCKDIELIGQGTVVFQADFSGSFIFYMSYCDFIVLKNITIKTASLPKRIDSLIYGYNNGTLIFRDCLFEGGKSAGVWIDGSFRALFDGCEFRKISGKSLIAEYSYYIDILDSVFRDNMSGIDIYVYKQFHSVHAQYIKNGGEIVIFNEVIPVSVFADDGYLLNVDTVDNEGNVVESPMQAGEMTYPAYDFYYRFMK
ncbi:MAG: SH3 domain-containing protein [Brevinematales bacterium]|nr:SH3 domain-containing protein [Brevinematales bacterium]